MKHTKIFVKIICIVCILAFGGIGVSAESYMLLSESNSPDYVGVDVDGNFDDWSDKPMTEICWIWDKNQNRYHEASVFVDDDNIYIYVKMSDKSYTGFNGYNWNITVNGVNSPVVVVPPDGSQTNNDGTTQLVVRNQNGYQMIDGASGALVKQNGKGDTAEIKIPKSFFTDDSSSVQTVEFNTPNLGPQTVTSVNSPTGPLVVALSGLFIGSCCAYFYSKKTSDRKFTGRLI